MEPIYRKLDNISFYCAAIIVTMGVLHVLSIYQMGFNHRKEMEKLDKIEQKLEQRNYTDSLYHEHLNKCAFVSKYELSMDSRGYFYSQYKRNPNKITSHAYN